MHYLMNNPIAESHSRIFLSYKAIVGSLMNAFSLASGNAQRRYKPGTSFTYLAALSGFGSAAQPNAGGATIRQARSPQDIA
nr:hypothetical protein [uncultured Pseudomonas sp.]